MSAPTLAAAILLAPPADPAPAWPARAVQWARIVEAARVVLSTCSFCDAEATLEVPHADVPAVPIPWCAACWVRHRTERGL